MYGKVTVFSLKVFSSLFIGVILFSLVVSPASGIGVFAQVEPPVPEPTPETDEGALEPPGEFAPPPAPDRLPSFRTGTIRYVATVGLNSGDCSNSASPCVTILYAIGQAVDGDTIDIAAGTYYENLTLNKDLTFAGAGMGQTVVNGRSTGAVFQTFSSAALNFSDMTITNGFVASGIGGGVATNGQLTMERVEVTGNTANGIGGGGIYATRDITLTDVSVTGNQTDAVGAGIYIKFDYSQTATLERVTVAHNTVHGSDDANFGGGLMLTGLGHNYLTNVTISDNSAWRGSAFTNHNADLNIRNSTIANNNTGKFNNGGIWNIGTLRLYNTIISNNPPYNCIAPGPIISVGYNIASDSYCFLIGTGDQPSTDPTLGSLADNGGYTQTHAIPQTSPAVDTGGGSNCPATDQRGYSRPVDGDNIIGAICDIGAYEYHWPTITTITADTPEPSLKDGWVTVNVSVSSSYTPVTGTVGISGASTTCNAVLSGGSGSCSVKFNTIGVKTLTATYQGDNNHDPSSDTESHTVVNLKIYYSQAYYDGWTLESSENSSVGGSRDNTSAVFMVGDNAQDRQYRGVLSFNTGYLPDNAIITSVQLKVRQESVTGSNPHIVLGKLWVDMQKGSFSSNPRLQAGDFQASSSKQAAGYFPNAPSGSQYTMTLSSGNYQYINLTGITQFRLRFNKDDNDDMGEDSISYYSGGISSYADKPMLVIKYYTP